MSILIKRRQQLILFKNQELARLDKVYDPFITASLKQHLTFLEQDLEQTEDAIAELCQSNREIKDKITKLTSIPGLGITLATAAISEVPELGSIDFNKLTSLTGLAPFARDSGKYNGKRSIFAGRANLRKILYMAAVASLRVNPKLKAFYDRLIASHKPPKVALVALMRKLLTFMNALLKNNSFWSPSYEKPHLTS